jgi:ATP-dependent DNA helicase RecG
MTDDSRVPSPSQPDPLDEPLAKGVLRGAAASRLEKALGLVTVGGLLRHYPRRYQHWGSLTPIAELKLGEEVTILAEVTSATTRQMKARHGQLMNVKVTDGTDVIDLAFFNASRLRQVVLPGRRLLFSGRVSLYRGKRQLSQPALVALDSEGDAEALAQIDRPLPIYPANSTLDTVKIHKAIGTVLDVLGEVPDPIPPDIRARHGLICLTEAFHQVHRPVGDRDWRRAQHRLKFEEAFILQIALARRRTADRAGTALPRRPRPGGLLEAFDERLPFTLTPGQLAVAEEIAADLAEPHPMHRLLQGEVGSGKTVVALRAMLTVLDSGGQAALLAPTEVLAAQHYRSICALLGPLGQRGMLGGDDRGTRVVLLTGSVTAASRRRVLVDAITGDAGIVVGTHALLQKTVEFGDLGLVVVDEQHRFGVEQRDALRGKGRTSTPHLLVMTATPIPRTVAMTVFGDLDVSTLRELPKGRSPITTHVVPANRESWYARAWVRVAEEVAAGHQAYVVCPRIHAGDAAGDEGPVGAEGLEEPGEAGGEDDGEGGAPARPPLRSVLEVTEELRANPVLAGLRIAVLHGQLPADERDATMRAFAGGQLDVLVSTTVIEVGVDVPNATIMVVMDADRFGVSQLHQLRGRVGRGEHPGLCLLMAWITPGASAGRLEAVAASQDGFELARVDLEARREGDVLGAKQSGTRSSLRLLRVLKDEKIIEAARHEASALVASDPDLELHPLTARALANLLDEEREAYLERG